MRHRRKTSQLATDSKHRKAMLRSLLRNFFLHGELETTVPRAKEVKRLADKLIGKAKKNDLATRRKLHEFFGKRDVVNTLVEKIAPVFAKRNSGFSRITRLSKRRGDNVEMAKLSLLEKVEGLGTLGKPEDKVKAKKSRHSERSEESLKKKPQAKTKKASNSKRSFAKAQDDKKKK